MVFYKSEGAMDAMWQEYGMEELEKGMQKLFPASRISVAELMGQLLQGDVLGAAGTLLQEVIQGMGASAAGRKNILIWLIVLGILSALLIHFVEVFDKHQIADLSFYFIYLLMGVILLQCFSGILGTARETVENIVLFVRLMVPTYLLAVGVAYSGSRVSADAASDLWYGKNTVGCGTTTDLLLWPVDHDQRDLGGGKADTFDGTSGKGGGLDSQGFSGSGHGDQRVPVIDHTGIGFRQDLRRGKGTFGTAGDRKCGRRASGAGGGFSRCHPQQHRRNFAVTASGGVCGSASGDFVYCVFDQVCGSFYGNRQR